MQFWHLQERALLSLQLSRPDAGLSRDSIYISDNMKPVRSYLTGQEEDQNRPKRTLDRLLFTLAATIHPGEEVPLKGIRLTATSIFRESIHSAEGREKLRRHKSKCVVFVSDFPKGPPTLRLHEMTDTFLPQETCSTSPYLVRPSYQLQF